jgi:hypothetical protein
MKNAKRAIMLPMFEGVNVMFLELLILTHIVKPNIVYILESLDCEKIVFVLNQNYRIGMGFCTLR